MTAKKEEQLTDFREVLGYFNSDKSVKSTDWGILQPLSAKDKLHVETFFHVLKDLDKESEKPQITQQNVSSREVFYDSTCRIAGNRGTVVLNIYSDKYLYPKYKAKISIELAEAPGNSFLDCDYTVKNDLNRAEFKRAKRFYLENLSFILNLKKN